MVLWGGVTSVISETIYIAWNDELLGISQTVDQFIDGKNGVLFSSNINYGSLFQFSESFCDFSKKNITPVLSTLLQRKSIYDGISNNLI